MPTFLYAIYDKNACLYNTPFNCVSDLMAERHFLLQIKNPNTIYATFLRDFALHKLGAFDTTTGEITPEIKLIVDGIQIMDDQTQQTSFVNDLSTATPQDIENLRKQMRVNKG